jgi:hypothetical protein
VSATASSGTPCELQAILRQVDPAVLLVSPRILRRVIKRDRELTGLGLRVPHRKSYSLERDNLLRIVSPREIDLPPDTELPSTVILLPQPTRRLPEGAQLLKYWRWLFHIRVHQALAERRQAGLLDPSVIQNRIASLGAVEFSEIEEVLREENMLLPPRHRPGGGGPPSRPPCGPTEVYEEFVAVYLELRTFDPHRLEAWFPGLLDRSAVDALLDAELDVADLRERTRPPGAWEPLLAATLEEMADPVGAETRAGLPPEPDPARFLDLSREADRALQRGNRVRNLILRQQALVLATTEQASAARQAVERGAEKLAARLHKALGFPASELPVWTRCLAALVEPAASGGWSNEARLLYDLQKVCINQEKPVYAVDLVECLVSCFRRPVQRPLPCQPPVLVVRHLRKALGRLPSARLSAGTHREWTTLLHSALQHAESRLRDQLRPPLQQALEAVGLVPTSVAENLARDKLVEELLDIVADHGFLTVSHLRDALARNRLKLPDLLYPTEFFTGDPLIRANRQLAWDADGVYRRGEIYLRWLQRLSSLFFGNPLGRFITLYALLPAGASFFTLMGLNELFELLHKFLGLHPIHVFHTTSFVGLALFFLLLIHLQPVRDTLLVGLQALWRGLRYLFIDLPQAFLALPIVRHVLQSRAWLLFYQFVLKPGVCALPVGLGLTWAGAEPAVTGLGSGAAYLLAVMVLHSPLGLYLEELWADRLLWTWNFFWDDLLPGLFRWIMYLSRTALDRFERGLYAVDEWLRFRAGEGRGAFWGKLILGFFWFWITYVARFVVNLLIEPQINPVKHFPVVTVSHKVMLVSLPAITQTLATRLSLPEAQVFAVLSSVIWFIPGIFGFLVWELKENWRLYRANQPATLEPEVVGSHGETVLRLLRPGFHSGTLPRLFARLRRAQGPAAATAQEGLHHVAHSLQAFVERNLLAVLAASQRWSHTATVAVGTVRLGTNRIRIELCCPGAGAESAFLEIIHVGDCLQAALVRPGWLAGLEGASAAAWNDALAGFLCLAGVEAVVGAGEAGESVRPVPPITWAEWVQWWERDRAGVAEGSLPQPVLPRG